MVSKTRLLLKTACFDLVAILMRESGKRVLKLRDRPMFFCERGFVKNLYPS
jgi:hypothetical protein